MTDTTAPSFNGNSKGLGVFHKAKETYLYYSLAGSNGADLQVLSSENGLSVETFHEDPVIIDAQGVKVNIDKTGNYRISELGTVYALTYLDWTGEDRRTSLALSKDLVHWKYVTHVPGIADTAVIVPNHFEGQKFLMFFGDHDIRVSEIQRAVLAYLGEDVQVLEHSPALQLHIEYSHARGIVMRFAKLQCHRARAVGRR